MKAKQDTRGNLYPIEAEAGSGRLAAGSGGDGGYSDVLQRLARLETRMENTATKTDIADLRTELKTDIANLKIWMLGGVILLLVSILGKPSLEILTGLLN